MTFVCGSELWESVGEVAVAFLLTTALSLHSLKGSFKAKKLELQSLLWPHVCFLISGHNCCKMLRISHAC